MFANRLELDCFPPHGCVWCLRSTAGCGCHSFEKIPKMSTTRTGCIPPEIRLSRVGVSGFCCDRARRFSYTSTRVANGRAPLIFRGTKHRGGGADRLHTFFHNGCVTHILQVPVSTLASVEPLLEKTGSSRKKKRSRLLT